NEARGMQARRCGMGKDRRRLGLGADAGKGGVVRCPYCRLVIADGSTSCAGCGRSFAGRAAGGGAGPRPRWAAPPEAEAAPLLLTGGCLWAIGATVVFVLVGAVVALVAVAAGRDPVPSGPAWSAAYAARFEAACGATGAGADYCRCARAESERVLTED